MIEKELGKVASAESEARTALAHWENTLAHAKEVRWPAVSLLW